MALNIACSVLWENHCHCDAVPLASSQCSYSRFPATCRQYIILHYNRHHQLRTIVLSTKRYSKVGICIDFEHELANQCLATHIRLHLRIGKSTPGAVRRISRIDLPTITCCIRCNVEGVISFGGVCNVSHFSWVASIALDDIHSLARFCFCCFVILSGKVFAVIYLFCKLINRRSTRVNSNIIQIVLTSVSDVSNIREA